MKLILTVFIFIGLKAWEIVVLPLSLSFMFLFTSANDGWLDDFWKGEKLRKVPTNFLRMLIIVFVGCFLVGLYFLTILIPLWLIYHYGYGMTFQHFIHDQAYRYEDLSSEMAVCYTFLSVMYPFVGYFIFVFKKEIKQFVVDNWNKAKKIQERIIK